MARVSVNELLERSALKQETVVNVPRWNCDVVIRELSAGELMQLRRDCTRKDGTVDEVEMTKGMLVAACLDPQFTREEVDALYNASIEPLNYLWEAAARLNRMGEAGQKEAIDSFPVEG